MRSIRSRVRVAGTVGLAALVWAMSLSGAQAQVFDSGSDGSYLQPGAATMGPLVVNQNQAITLDMPADGKFKCSTITVSQGGTLTFNRNKLNTPVYLLATGDVNIQGTINVVGGDGNSNPPVGGIGGPGGFDGGIPGFSGIDPGAGYGPGAGLGGDQTNTLMGAGGAAYGGVSDGPGSGNGKAYGSGLLVPIVGGSGGGGTSGSPGFGGGGGGGAVLVASNTKITITGNINASGGRGFSQAGNCGSGGAIRLIAPKVGGTGQLYVSGGAFSHTAGSGRIRIDTLDRTSLQLGFQPNSGNATVGSFMLVNPSPLPRLDITQVGSTSISVGSDPVVINLPFGTNPNQPVTVQAKDFTGMVAIALVLTPESGVPTVLSGTIDMSLGNPGTFTFNNVMLPVNTATHINVWTQ